MNLTIPFIVLAIMFVAVVIGWSETWKKKEHYRCRVFDLTDGKEGSNLIKVGQEDSDGWHKASDTPCPGSLIVCENGEHQLYFGYAVAHDNKACLLCIPNWLQDYHKERGNVELKIITPIPLFMFTRWQYIERRILPTETLGTYAQMYKR